jgi:16S rRNA (guanine(966)-N(2))-methyltransferase RsmD
MVTKSLSPSAQRASQALRIRLIGGLWRRMLIPVPAVVGLRPTPDRVRETLFNWLGQSLDGWRVLDLFAGSGALGFEAASRGARHVCLVEHDACALRALRATAARLRATQIRIEGSDALAMMARLAGERARDWDLIFLDPPFGAGWPERVRPLLASLLAPRGYLYLEAESALAKDLPARERWFDAGFEVIREASAGRVHYHLLQLRSQSSHEDSGIPGHV